MKPRILLLFPNTSNDGVMPLAIAILSTIAREAGADVEYFETSFYKKHITAGEEREQTGEFRHKKREKVLELLPYESLKKDFNKKIRDFKPDVLAVTANSLEYELFCELINGIDDRKQKPFVIVGGCHATVDPEEVIAHQDVDAVCVGEGEEAWKDFLFKFKRGEDYSDIQNLWVKAERGIKRNALRSLLEEDKLWATTLDYTFFDERHFLYVFDGVVYKRGQIELSRGCPFHCSYCVNSAFKDAYKGLGKFVRIRPFENVKKELKRLVNLNCEIIQFQDECFLSVPYERLERFCKWYKKEVGLPMMLATRPESVSEKKIKLLSDMDVPTQISLGVESGNPRILKEICNRHMTLAKIKEAFRIIKKHNIRATAYTMIGLPTETRDEAFETISLIRDLDLDVSIMSIFFPFKGVPLRQYCLDHGYITGEEKARTFTDASVLRNQPMTQDEISTIRRTYALYTRLPKEYILKVELCEKNYEKHKELFKQLVALLHDKYYSAWKLR